MAENLKSAACTEQEYQMAREAGLLVMTTQDEIAVHKFAEAARMNLQTPAAEHIGTLDPKFTHRLTCQRCKSQAGQVLREGSDFFDCLECGSFTYVKGINQQAHARAAQVPPLITQAHRDDMRLAAKYFASDEADVVLGSSDEVRIVNTLLNVAAGFQATPVAPSDDQIDAAAKSIGLAYGGRGGDMRRLVHAVMAGHQEPATLQDFMEHFDSSDAWRNACAAQVRIQFLEAALDEQKALIVALTAQLKKSTETIAKLTASGAVNEELADLLSEIKPFVSPDLRYRIVGAMQRYYAAARS